MLFLSSPPVLLAVAIAVSFFYTIYSTDNPASIPYRIIFPRALGGLVYYLVFWWPVSLAIFYALAVPFPSLESSMGWRCCSTLLLGFLLSQSGTLKDVLLAPRIARFFRLPQLVDEQTRLYLGRIIDREERKISIVFFREDHDRRERALDRMFEEHNIEIARSEAGKPDRHPESVLGVFKVHNRAVKFKYLIRHLGYTECLRSLKLVANNPELILPAWPSDDADRRRSSGPESGRRKYEQAHVQAYVLGLTGTHLKRKFQVFVSSTFLDLREERQRVLRALLCAECVPSGMEFFPSSDEELLSLIHGFVDECDFYLLLIGSRYGSTTHDGISYTEAEYDYATSRGKPVVVLIQAAPPPSHEEAEEQKKLKAFKEKVCRAHAPGYWNSPDEILLLVSQAIERLKREHPEGGWIRYVRSRPK